MEEDDKGAWLDQECLIEKKVQLQEFTTTLTGAEAASEKEAGEVFYYDCLVFVILTWLPTATHTPTDNQKPGSGLCKLSIIC